MIKSERLIDVGTDFLMCAYAIELGRNGQNSPVPTPASYAYPIPEANTIFIEGAFTEVLALPVSVAAIPPPAAAAGGLYPQRRRPRWIGNRS